MSFREAWRAIRRSDAYALIPFLVASRCELLYAVIDASSQRGLQACYLMVGISASVNRPRIRLRLGHLLPAGCARPL
jgi:hypothetical protein